MLNNYYVNKYNNNKSAMQERIAEIDKEFALICEGIAEQCEQEGCPSHGSNYELRASQEWKVMYSEEYDELLDAIQKLDEEAE